MATSSRSARLAKWGSIPAGFLLSALLVWQASHAAFSDSTSNPDNNWQAGSVTLTDDDAGSALFDAKNLTPRDSAERCIVGTYEGSVPAELKLYGENASSTKDLDGHLHLEIVAGTGGSFGSCEGFTPHDAPKVYDGTLANFASTYTNYASGIAIGETTGNGSESMTYRFRYTLAKTAPNSVQGGTAGIGFTWEAKSLNR